MAFIHLPGCLFCDASHLLIATGQAITDTVTKEEMELSESTNTYGKSFNEILLLLHDESSACYG